MHIQTNLLSTTSTRALARRLAFEDVFIPSSLPGPSEPFNLLTNLDRVPMNATTAMGLENASLIIRGPARVRSNIIAAVAASASTAGAAAVG